MDYKSTEKIYNKILKLVEENKDSIIFNLKDLSEKAQCHLFAIELKEKYNILIDPKDVQSTDYIDVGQYRKIARFGEKHHRTISWEDSGKQPDDEVLLQLSFGTGPFMFSYDSNNDYPKDLFDTFFNELKTYEPKYTDTVNKYLFYAREKAGKIFNDFPIILNKYHKINEQNVKERRAIRLKEELSGLEQDINIQKQENCRNGIAPKEAECGN